MLQTIRLSSLMVIIALTAFSCHTQKKTAGVDELSVLQSVMMGSYSSTAQSVRDTDYYDITLHMYPIWKERKGEHWLYVEQSVTARQDKPYRQRVYQLRKDANGRLESAVFMLPDEGKWIGAWKNPEKFNSIQPSDIEEKVGCSVFLDKKGGTYIGGTEGAVCFSQLRGATYATSKVTVTATMVNSWDQGFDADGKQVWGAEKGPYEFVRMIK